jgi:hypothetical protein
MRIEPAAALREQTRARYPVQTGYVERDGVVPMVLWTGALLALE